MPESKQMIYNKINDNANNHQFISDTRVSGFDTAPNLRGSAEPRRFRNTDSFCFQAVHLMCKAALVFLAADRMLRKKTPPGFRGTPEVDHSVRKLFTGLAMAALIAWKLTVINAINVVDEPAKIKIHQLRSTR